MDKSPKADLPLELSPQDPFEAKEAIRKGQVAPIGSYLRDDVRMILESLADQLDVPHADDSPLDIAGKTDLESADDQCGSDHDWDSNSSDVLKCIEEGKWASVGCCLRDLADFLSDLGRAFDPKAASEIWKLTFSRRRRGPPVDNLKAGNQRWAVRMTILSAGGKKEAAVQELVERGNMSRATAFRRLAKPKSHKKKK
jgi:hypothetical protein